MEKGFGSLSEKSVGTLKLKESLHIVLTKIVSFELNRVYYIGFR